MPRAPKYCNKQGCDTLVIAVSYCPEHQRKWGGRGSPRTTTPEHRALRLRVLNRDHHLCRIQYPDICISTATICDHIKALGLNGHDTDVEL